MRCTKHGLALASDGKCVRCRQEDEDAAAEAMEAVRRPGRQRGTVLGALLIVLGIGIAAAAFVASRPRAVSAGSAASAPVPSTVASLPKPVPSAPVAALAPGLAGPDEANAAAGAAEETALQRAAKKVEITLYCRPTACARVRQWMLDRGYTFHELNVDADPRIASAWQAIAPDGTVPAFDVEGQRFAGFDEERVTNAVRYAAAHRLQR